jgi:hypothetical protein
MTIKFGKENGEVDRVASDRCCVERRQAKMQDVERRTSHLTKRKGCWEWRDSNRGVLRQVRKNKGDCRSREMR